MTRAKTAQYTWRRPRVRCHKPYSLTNQLGLGAPGTRSRAAQTLDVTRIEIYGRLVHCPM